MKLFTSQLSFWALTSTLCFLFLMVECIPLRVRDKPYHKALRRELQPSAIDVSRIVKLLQSSSVPKIEPRSITAFVTDPALLVTILHSLEIAYWTLPFGFILTPIINLFRMPNRRMDGRIEGDSQKVQQFYRTLAKAIEKIEKLNAGKTAGHARIPPESSKRNNINNVNNSFSVV